MPGRARRVALRAAAVGATAFALLAVTAIPALAAHTVSGYFPTQVATGCYVTIQGTGFTGTPTVTFTGGGASASVILDSSTRITALVPAGSTTGSVTVTIGADVVVGPSLTVSGSGGCPTVSTMTPSTGPVGTTVSFTGTNFNTSPGTMFVRFGSTDVAASNVTLTTLTATVPAGTTGSVPVRVTNILVGSGLSPTNFTVSTAAPTITSFNPTSGPVGTSVVITGTGFTGATAVRFNNVSATYTVNSDTQITATVPSTATTGRITVTTPSGTATSSTDFTVTGLSHDRSVSFQVSGHLKVTGAVNAADGFAACENKVGVRIQKQKSGGGWQTLTTLQTNTSGGFKGWVPDKEGRYRARVPGETLLNGAQCGADTSPARRHSH